MNTREETPDSAPATAARRRRALAGSRRSQGGGGAVYGIGMVGALVYFAGRARTPREYALAVGRAAVWPAILVFLALKRLEA